MFLLRVIQILEDPMAALKNIKQVGIFAFIIAILVIIPYIILKKWNQFKNDRAQKQSFEDELKDLEKIHDVTQDTEEKWTDDGKAIDKESNS